MFRSRRLDLAVLLAATVAVAMLAPGEAQDQDPIAGDWSLAGKNGQGSYSGTGTIAKTGDAAYKVKLAYRFANGRPGVDTIACAWDGKRLTGKRTTTTGIVSVLGRRPASSGSVPIVYTLSADGLALEGRYGAFAERLARAAPDTIEAPSPGELGATDLGTGVRFRVLSTPATRVEVWLYDKPAGADEKAHFALAREGSTPYWSGKVPAAVLAKNGLAGTIYYGYRAWGPNWTHDPAWTKGSDKGFVADVDGQGNRFNPNKLLFDPYARELSHDPLTPTQLDGTVYGSGSYRTIDSGRVAPKGIVLKKEAPAGAGPSRAFKDEVIYEVHLRGLTMNDASVPPAIRGTYAGAARRAAYLKGLGVTAVELLPVQETQNDTNDVSAGTDGDNYWGYMTLDYFAPDRRYSSDKSPGGPTREFKQMVRAFHAAGIKVYLDVVYNHTGEGGLWDATGNTANVLSFRGLDNAGYYELAADAKFYYDNTGCGGNFNVASDVGRALILDSLRYWRSELGIDGFRFDLASVLGNAAKRNGFRFDKMDPNNVLNRIVREVPGADLVAEAWAIGDGTYQVGNFPSGWSEWNGQFRDTFRKLQNKLGQEAVTPGQLAARFAGSSDLFQDDGRKPWASVNFMVAHDGFTLRDLYGFNQKNNGRPWPYGPSDGGEDNNNSWDQGGDATLQRQAARNGMAFLMLSAGVPMITGGDELLRTQYGNNNVYNLDSDKNWLDWTDIDRNRAFFNYTSKLVAFRRAHPALRPAEFFRGTDKNGNGLKDIAWLTDRGAEADQGYMANAENHFLAFRIDGTELGDPAASIYVATNGWSARVDATLPKNLPGKKWYRVLDTAAWMEGNDNIVAAGAEELMDGASYGMNGRSVLVLIER